MGPHAPSPLLGAVLVVAPDLDLRLYLRLSIVGLAAEVLEAADGRQALARVAERRPDLVIAERRMPHLDGLELCRELEQRGVPVLLLNGDTAEEARRAGAAAVLAKPFDRRQLRRGVCEALGRAGHRRSFSLVEAR